MDSLVGIGILLATGAVAALLASLRSDLLRTAAGLQRSLSNIEASLEGLDRSLRQSLRKIGEDLSPESTGSLPGLLLRLTGDDDVAGRQAGEILARIGDPARPLLIEALRDPGERVRTRAAAALGAMRTPADDALDALRRALEDPVPRVREAVAAALGSYGPGAVAALRQALDDADPSVRSASITALGKVGPAAREAATEALARLADDPSAPLRAQVLHALIGIEAPPEAVVRLFLSLAEKDPSVLSAEHLTPLKRYGLAADKLVPALVPLLDHRRDPVRHAAEETLTGLGSAAVPALLAALDHESETLRRRAARALGEIGPPARAALPRLERASTEWDGRGAKYAATAVKKIQPPGASA